MGKLDGFGYWTLTKSIQCAIQCKRVLFLTDLGLGILFRGFHVCGNRLFGL